jgi:transcriptional regulator with GAF, ATPase, and Fis domain
MQLDRAEAERQVILEILLGVMITSNLDELLKLIHQSISRVLYAENCFVALLDPDTEFLHFKFFVDKFDPAPPPRPLTAKTLSGYVLRTGRPLLISDVNDELFRKLEAAGEVELTGTDAPSWLGVPLQTPTRTVGLLVVQHYDDNGVYSERDIEFLSSVAGQVGLAIERKQSEEEKERLIAELKESLAKVKTLSGFLPICASCKKIRDDSGYWNQIEVFIQNHSEAEFSHSICPTCREGLYPGLRSKSQPPER